MHPQTLEPTEYAPYHALYISLVKTGDVLGILQTQIQETAALFAGLNEAQGDLRYAPGKWSVKELIGHLADTERILSYRALRIARNDKTPIEGFEQDDYVREGPSGHRRLSELVEEFQAVRRATILLFSHFQPEAWLRRGIASQNQVSVRALAYIIAGHELHHRSVLSEKYLKA